MIRTRVIVETIVIDVGDVTGAGITGWKIMDREDVTTEVGTMSVKTAMRNDRDDVLSESIYNDDLCFQAEYDTPIPNSREFSELKHSIIIKLSSMGRL